MMVARLVRPLLVLAALTLPAFAAAEGTIAAGECSKGQLADMALTCTTIEEASAAGVETIFCRCSPSTEKKGASGAPSNSGVRHEYH